MSENEPWYKEDTSEEDKLYEDAVNRVREAVSQNVSFQDAVNLLELEDENLRAMVIDDALKVIIAERHFMAKESLEKVAKDLKLPYKKLEQARQEMIDDVEQSAIDQYKSETGQTGNA